MCIGDLLYQFNTPERIFKIILVANRLKVLIVQFIELLSHMITFNQLRRGNEKLQI